MNDTNNEGSYPSTPDALPFAGVKYDAGKVRWSLMPIHALNEIARNFTIGAKKYADHNWRKGMSYERLNDALMRHLTAFRAGERNDAEIGVHHLACVGFYVLVLLEQELLGFGIDDRQHTLPPFKKVPDFSDQPLDGEPVA